MPTIKKLDFTVIQDSFETRQTDSLYFVDDIHCVYNVATEDSNFFICWYVAKQRSERTDYTTGRCEFSYFAVDYAALSQLLKLMSMIIILK